MVQSVTKEYEGAVAKAKLVCTITGNFPHLGLALLSFDNLDYPTGIIYIEKKSNRVKTKKFKYNKISIRQGELPVIQAEQIQEKSIFGSGKSLFGLLDLEGHEILPVRFRGTYTINAEVYAGANLSGGLELYRHGEMVAYINHLINLSSEGEFTRDEKGLTVFLDYNGIIANSSLSTESKPQELTLWCIYGREILYYKDADISRVIKIKDSNTHFYDLHLYYNNSFEADKIISAELILNMFSGKISPGEYGFKFV